jgi:uncharacterized Zn-finger protein
MPICFALTELIIFRMHEKEHYKPYQCEDCPERKAHKRDLERHIANAHKDRAKELDIDTEIFYCSYCGKEFTRYDNLLKHINKKRCKGWKG